MRDSEMRAYVGVTTALALFAVWAAGEVLDPTTSWPFVPALGRHAQGPLSQQVHASDSPAWKGATSVVDRPLAAMHATLGTGGLLAFGLGFGVVAAMVRRAGGRRLSRGVSLRAADIEVAEKTETKPVAYLENIPRTIIDKKLLDTLLSSVPKEQWEDPPEDSYLYVLKMYAETYGEGKATKMGWWDYYYLKANQAETQDILSGAQQKAERDEYVRMLKTGEVPMYVPVATSLQFTGATLKWRGTEPFAGDQVRSVVSDGLFAKQFLKAMAFYRDGLKPWQRGLEIGMAHGYFIIGPFVSLGPLRNTPEAATVGLLAGIALIGIVSVGGLLFGTTVKPTLFDKKGDKPAAGFQEMINWHALGGVGGAGFAHALITVFGS